LSAADYISTTFVKKAAVEMPRQPPEAAPAMRTVLDVPRALVAREYVESLTHILDSFSRVVELDPASREIVTRIRQDLDALRARLEP